MFQHIPELVNRYLMPPDPILLHYTVNPAVSPPERPLAWDVEIKTEDGAMKNRMTTMVQTSKESAQELTKLDEEVGTSLLSFKVPFNLVFFTWAIDRIACTVFAQLAP
jgi:SWI/SNF-related matrix-associated actin-dependent regulator of chromatin subfamily D